MIRISGGSPRAIRYVGLAGSIALAIAAVLKGALPELQTHVSPQDIASGRHGPLIMVLWLAGTAALGGAWWLGLRLPGTGRITTRWVIGTAALWMLPMLVVPPTGSRDVYAYACQGDLYAAGRDSYHEGVSALPCQWLDSMSHIWRSTPTPYGPLYIMFEGFAARLGSLTAAIVAFRLLAVAGVALIAYSLPPIARRLGRPVDRTLWLALASPLVAVHLIGGAHNDAITLGLLAAAVAVMITWYDRMAGWVGGGTLIGLSLAIKPTILVAVPFLVLYAAGGADAPTGTGARDHGPLGFPPVRAIVTRGGPVLASAFVGLLIPTLISGLGFGWIDALLHAGGGISWTSVSSATGITIDSAAGLFGAHLYVVPAVRTIGVYALVAALVLIFWRGRHDNRLYAAGMALLAVTFFAPFIEPWYLLWPLVLFAMTPARVGWFVAIVVASCFTAMPNGNGLDPLGQKRLSLLTTALGIAGIVAGIRWLWRGRRPAVTALPTATAVAPATAVTPATTPPAESVSSAGSMPPAGSIAAVPRPAAPVGESLPAEPDHAARTG